MTARNMLRAVVIFAMTLVLAGCGGRGLFGGGSASQETLDAAEAQAANTPTAERQGRESIFDLLNNADDPNVTVEVNRYIWNATLEILDFMPIEAVDPFSGVIVYGFGTPPGSSRAYRATVLIQDPALDARSLNVSLVSRAGPADTETTRAIEDAILTRARQLRVRDSNL